ncbi:MAG: DNA repair protein RadC [Lachnospiraceae bacterium]|nr:DNA repair protein RadC [Lachnospiraceae bacterium]
MKHLRMNELSKEDKPYEKCQLLGAQALTDAELLAVILRCGSQGCSSLELSSEILKMSKAEDGLLGIYHLSLSELKRIKGIGTVKAVQIKCIGELSARISRLSARQKLLFDKPESIASYYMESLRHEEQEHMICLMLDTKNRMIGDAEISVGTVNSSLVSPREVFLTAMQFHAVHIILVHNHPSGDATPSREDLLVTSRIFHAGALLGIELLDHIVIGDRCYRSLFRDGRPMES